MLHLLTEQDGLIHDFINELRDVDIQSDRMRFRKNMFRIGQYAAVEISHQLEYESLEVVTPLGLAKSRRLTTQPVVATILRAGVPLYEGVLDFYDKADSAFIAAYRKHAADESFTISRDYITCPDLSGRDLIMSDPMLATGASLIDAIDALQEYGSPKSIHIVVAIASETGVEMLRRSYPQAHLWVGAIDSELTSKGYIVPGLGDAGDLSYGPKLQF
jgi:uracil phosphoribosyltransferase